MSSYVANFAATGDPNSSPHTRHNLPAWAGLRTNVPQVMELGADFESIGAADSSAKYAFLRSYLESQATAY